MKHQRKFICKTCGGKRFSGLARMISHVIYVHQLSFPLIASRNMSTVLEPVGAKRTLCYRNRCIWTFSQTKWDMDRVIMEETSTGPA